MSFSTLEFILIFLYVVDNITMLGKYLTIATGLWHSADEED